MIIVVTHQLRQIAKVLEEGDLKEAVRLVHELREEIDESGLNVTVASESPCTDPQYPHKRERIRKLFAWWPFCRHLILKSRNCPWC